MPSSLEQKLFVARPLLVAHLVPKTQGLYELIGRTLGWEKSPH